MLKARLVNCEAPYFIRLLGAVKAPGHRRRFLLTKFEIALLRRAILEQNRHALQSLRPQYEQSLFREISMRDDTFDDEPYDPDSTRPPSKSQRKREATALQDLGERLVELTAVQLKQIPLPDDLLAAVKAAQTMNQRGAHKRQLQLIGKLMRRLDDLETAAIRTALATVQTSRR